MNLLATPIPNLSPLIRAHGGKSRAASRGRWLSRLGRNDCFPGISHICERGGGFLRVQSAKVEFNREGWGGGGGGGGGGGRSGGAVATHFPLQETVSHTTANGPHRGSWSFQSLCRWNNNNPLVCYAKTMISLRRVTAW